MRTVTFAKLYRHRLPNGHADYPASATLTVSEDVAGKALRAGALKADPLDHDKNGAPGGSLPESQGRFRRKA